MKILKLLPIFFFAVALVAALLALTACGEPEPCLTHVDIDGDNICDNCEAEISPEPLPEDHRDENRNNLCDECGAECFPDCDGEHINENGNNKCDVCGLSVPVDITFHIKDQYGNPIAGVSITLTDADLDTYCGTTGADGKAVIALTEGGYGISFDLGETEENYIAGETSIIIGEGDTLVEFEFIDNTPNGTLERPFVLSTDGSTLSLTIPAGEKYEYKIPFGGGRTAIFRSPDIEILYHSVGEGGEITDTRYTPSPEGEISFKLVETDTNTPSLFSIENKSGESITLELVLAAERGSLANPIVIDDISSPVLCPLSAETTVYYKWVATERASLVVGTELTYVLRRGTASAAPLVKTSVEAGLLGTYTAVLDGETVTLVIGDGTIEITDGSESEDNIGGSYLYTVEGGTVSITDTENEPVSSFSITAGGATVYITNNRHSHQVVIRDEISEVELEVSEGDEIIFAISSAYDTDLSLNISLEELPEEE